MRSYVVDHRDRQDAAPVMVDCYGAEIYAGEQYFKAEGGLIFSETTFRQLKDACELRGVVMEVEACRA